MGINLGIITAEKKMGIFYKEQLEYLFGEIFFINCYSIEENNFSDFKSEKLFLITTTAFDENKKILNKLSKNVQIVIGNVTFKEDTIIKLKKLSPKTKSILVNSSPRMAIEAIATLYQKGVTNIEFFPFYPGCIEKYENIKLAITPGEIEKVPKKIKNIIDIGNRVLDKATIVELAFIADGEYLLGTERFKEYFSNISTKNIAIDSLIEKNSIYRSQIELLSEITDIGIIEIDRYDRVINCNSKALSYLDISKQSLFFYKSSLDFIKDSINKTKEELKKISKEWKKIKIDIYPIIKYDIWNGCYIIFYKNQEKKNNISRYLGITHGHIAKYTFDDIITQNDRMIKIKEHAKKMAKSDSSILLTGNTGTGKELFAHSIHNYSERKNLPFVAINCAAINESILEAELFGYEEGAFTGAKKGGKIGLFELGNGGTIFLDEIEGINFNIQLKLLRVIQEKKIIRVGGEKLIPIDIRIVSATNENLNELVKNGKFRKDLFFRLNTLPINLLDLKDRKDDIELLIKIFKLILKTDFILTIDAKQALLNYSWPGNIRELKNTIEYLKCLEEEIINYDMLPNYLKNDTTNIIDENDNEIFLNDILKLLVNTNGMGRKKIRQKLEKKSIFLSEGTIRTKLENLKEKGYISSSKGRGGSKITKLGKKYLISKK